MSQYKIEKVPTQVEYYDVMHGAERLTISKVDGESGHGFVSLVDCMPRLIPVGETADYAIATAARCSYQNGTKRVNNDKILVRYLKRHKHSSPEEMCVLKFHIKCPIFVARQWLRHRTASVNEISGRYSVITDKYYQPEKEDIKLQSETNKQGTSEQVVDDFTAEQFLDYLASIQSKYEDYINLMNVGLAREQARMGLPLNIYTEFYWTLNLRNLFHFLGLRLDSHAQQEIRWFAEAILEIVKDVFPVSAQAFLDYDFNSVSLSALEIEAISNKSNTLSNKNERETKEYLEKLTKLGLKFE